MALGQNLQKLTIHPVQEDGQLEAPFAPIELPFNPTEYGIERGVSWAEIAIPGLDAPVSINSRFRYDRM